jgi:hypothetical protein
VPGLLPSNNRPPHSCEVEAMVELITVRLADLVSGRLSDDRRVQSYRAALGVRAKRGPQVYAPKGPSPRRSQCLSPLGGQHPKSVRSICGSFV